MSKFVLTPEMKEFLQQQMILTNFKLKQILKHQKVEIENKIMLLQEELSEIEEKLTKLYD